MIIFHADDYGVNIKQSKRILMCREKGCLNSVSIIPTSRHLKETIPLIDGECKKGVHINLSEGYPLSEITDIPLLVDKKGLLNRSFIECLLLSILKRKEFEKEVEVECYLQLRKVISYMPSDYKLRVDSHRHYHMIPGVLRGLCKAIDRIGIEVEYIRLPMENLSLYLSEPKLWHRIPLLSIIKAIVLIICGIYNKSYLRKKGLLSKTSEYIGVIFTDRMYIENITPLILRINKDKRYKGKDVEIQFHPGQIKEGEDILDVKFKEWYASSNRKMEAKALMQLARIENAG